MASGEAPTERSLQESMQDSALPQPAEHDVVLKSGGDVLLCKELPVHRQQEPDTTTTGIGSTVVPPRPVPRPRTIFKEKTPFKRFYQGLRTGSVERTKLPTEQADKLYSELYNLYSLIMFRYILEDADVDAYRNIDKAIGEVTDRIDHFEI